MKYPVITLIKGREKSLERKHPWIFSGGIKSKPASIQDGDLVNVVDYTGNILGVGMYQEGSIMVRMVSFEDIDIEQNFWNQIIGNAYKYRKGILGFPSKETNAFRLFHGEGDGISGLIIDIYNKTAVVQFHNIGVHKMQDMIIKALVENLEFIKSIYVKSKETLPDNYSQTLHDGFIYGDEIESDTVVEYGNKFIVNWVEGQKTGFFLDQRENRKLVGENSNGKTVLNCFCYTGGFSIYAGHKASKVDSVDISEKAMHLTDQNIELNSIKNHTSYTANVLDFLTQNKSIYDIVIVDPPAFAKNISKRHNAIQAYKRLNILAIKAVKKGGLIFTFSCSQVVTMQLFYDTIIAAGIEAGRNIRVMQHLSQGADHPVNLFHPEGHYLKGLMIYVE